MCWEGFPHRGNVALALYYVSRLLLFTFNGTALVGLFAFPVLGVDMANQTLSGLREMRGDVPALLPLTLKRKMKRGIKL